MAAIATGTPRADPALCNGAGAIPSTSSTATATELKAANATRTMMQMVKVMDDLQPSITLTNKLSK